MNKIKEAILKNDITLIAITSQSKVSFIINLINELSIKDKKSTSLFSFNTRSQYYSLRLISFLSGLNRQLIRKYAYPYVTLSKNNTEAINRDKYIDAIEKIQKSNILMCSEKYNNEDYLDYILNYSNSDVLIIDDFYSLLTKTKYNLSEVFSTIKNRKNSHIVLFIYGKDKTQESIIQEYKRYIHNFIFVDKDTSIVKEIN